MFGSTSEIAAFFAFAAIQFGGYVFAGATLRRLQPRITTSLYRIAALRIGLGIVVGPLLVLGFMFFSGYLATDFHPTLTRPSFYLTIFVMRALLWMMIILLFTKDFKLVKSKLVSYAFAGAAWSCGLDLACIALGLVKRHAFL